MEKTNIKIRKNWIRDTSEPQECYACSEEYNGINYGFIQIGSVRIKTWLCDNCLEKLKSISPPKAEAMGIRNGRTI